MEHPEIDGGEYRRVFGRVPTAVSIVTAMDGDQPVAMVIGSFGSVSMDPPLVQFMPGKSSESWKRMSGAGSFCVNVLGDDQVDLSNSFFVKDVDPFTACTWDTAVTGAPRIEGCAAWIDCVTHEVVDAGDHWLILGRIVGLDGDSDRAPLVFLGGSYGSFEAH